ncbi:MAG: ABC transporter ATP-binding protein, partial [Jiangellaceae bacterium]
MSTVLALEAVSKRFGDVTAVDGVSLEVERGELLAVVGPSGCGKSTLMRSIAGLTRIDGGRIVIGDREIAGPKTWVPPERRSVGVVFQDSALFPHLSVAENVSFGLGRRDPSRSQRTREMLSLVGLEDLSERYPHELSG